MICAPEFGSEGIVAGIMSDDIVDPSKRYPCKEGAVPALVYLKRDTPWPLVDGARVLYRKTESSSAPWHGAVVSSVDADGFFVLEKS